MATEDPVYRYGVYGGLLPTQRHELARVYPPQRAVETLAVEAAWWAS